MRRHLLASCPAVMIRTFSPGLAKDRRFSGRVGRLLRVYVAVVLPVFRSRGRDKGTGRDIVKCWAAAGGSGRIR